MLGPPKTTQVRLSTAVFSSRRPSGNKMASLPYIQIYIADYLADTAHLTAAQHGAYLLLIFNYWQKGHSLNNSNERLTNVARMNQQEWNESRGVLQEFFTIEGDEWVHERIEEDLERVRVKTTQKSNAGRASAQQRGNKRSTKGQLMKIKRKRKIKR